MSADVDDDAAPFHAVPSTRLTSLELPFTLAPSGPSHAAAIASLGGSFKLSSQLAARDANDPVEMQLKAGDLFAHPVQGEFIKTGNVLVRVTKRKRKDGTGEKFFKVDPVGVVADTVRFRSMADYQYAPDPTDPISKLSMALRTMDVEAIKAYRFPPETEDYESDLRLFPPPLFSRIPIPQYYQYKSNAATTRTAYTRPDGTEGERLISKARYSGTIPTEITFDVEEVPQAAPAEALSKQKGEDVEILRTIQQLFMDRPIWSRQALADRLGPDVIRSTNNNKHFWACVGYRFSDGPYRELLARFGYDPRQHQEARLYQPLRLRITENKTEARGHARYQPTGPTTDKGKGKATDDEQRHPASVFDGKRISRQQGNFQLCDITDPLLQSLIHSSAGVLPFCSPRDGWYTPNAFTQLRLILRRKFVGLLENPPRIVGDVECNDLLDMDVAPGTDDLEPPSRQRTKAEVRAMAKAREAGRSAVLESPALSGVGLDGDEVMEDVEPEVSPVVPAEQVPSSVEQPQPTGRSRKPSTKTPTVLVPLPPSAKKRPQTPRVPASAPPEEDAMDVDDVSIEAPPPTTVDAANEEEPAPTVGRLRRERRLPSKYADEDAAGRTPARRASRPPRPAQPVNETLPPQAQTSDAPSTVPATSAARPDAPPYETVELPHAPAPSSNSPPAPPAPTQAPRVRMYSMGQGEEASPPPPPPEDPPAQPAPVSVERPKRERRSPKKYED